MTTCKNRNWHSDLLGVFSIIGVLAHVIFCCENHALAQITPDGTLGNNSSKVTRNVNIKGSTADRIDGGATRGANLFHSFREFNVEKSQRVYFANPTGIKNILTRVTGSNVSNILGTLGVDGGANLFFINPNGILFGKNARLDVAGSFVASTANSFVFGNGLEFSATNPQTPSPLLTVNPSALLFNQITAAPIQNNSVAPVGIDPAGFNAFGLRVGDGKSLLLVGGNISMDGGQLNAYGGRVELGGLAAPGNVKLVFSGDNLSLKFPDNVTRASVSLTNQAVIYVEGAGDGDIAINARNLEILGGSGLSAGIGVGLGTPEIVAGDITLNATGEIKIAGSKSGIRNFVPLGSKGNGGNITIDSGDFSLSDGAKLSASTYGQGNAGNVTVNAKNAVSLANGDILSTVEAGGVGKGGNIDINATSLSLIDGAQLLTSTRKASDTQPAGRGDAGNVNVKVTGAVDIAGDKTGFPSGIGSSMETGTVGNGGNITIDSGSFSLRDGAQLVASTFGVGNAGNVTVGAKNAVHLADAAYIFSTVEAGGVGKGGNIDINAANLSLTNSTLLTITRGASDTQPAGRGDAGNVNLKVTGAVDIAGEKNGFRSGIFSSVSTGTVGNGGNITIDSGDFSLRDGAQLSASTAGKGNGGSISVNASENVSFNGSFTGIINAVLQNAKGQGGDIRIKSDSLSVTNGAQLIATTFGEGNAGSVIINTSKNVSFDGGDDFGFVSGVFNDVNQTGMGRGGDIRISANSLSVTNGAELTSSTYGKGDAGDVIIDVNTVSFKGLRITNERKLSSGVFSNVQQGAEGNGGKIQITTDSLSIADNAELDVGTFGRGNSGNVIIDARGDIYFDNGNIFSSVEKGADGRGGDIRISSKNISFTNSAEIQTGTKGQGDAGNVTITARDRISFDGVGRYAFQTGFSPSGIFSAVSEIAKGRGGNIFLDTRSLSMTNGAQLFASTYGQGNAGNIRINAKDVITISGTSQESGFSSALLTFTNSTSTGIGGDITVNTNIFRLWNGALLSASTANNRNGGDITVNASIFEALNGGQLATTTSSNGSAGKITLRATDRVIVSGSDRNYNDRIAKFPLEFIDNISANSGLFVSSTSSGITGDIEINSPKITLDNQGKLNAESASGNGGNINVNSNLLLLRRNSQISTNAGTEKLGGNGGNININSRFIVAVPNENSDISANAFTGIGGRVDITTNGIYGILPQKSPTENSDITASSELGVSGQVTINSPDTDPSRGLIQLPSNLVDASQQIAQGCTPRRGQNASRFIATGRGGLPQSPNEPLRGRAVITSWVDLPAQATAITDKLSTASMTKSDDRIVEAQGWIVDTNGNIMLVAQSPQSFSIPSAMSCSQ
ncbi:MULTISPECIES: filamentous hemagglutinin N-terminal domain-containing protein [unclassified Nostoc]|uniref:two-partner secretion domain-containing protein n=1 Tax=unclassified Nostoc TaxID=2593658 RepID=UPI001D3496D1|nr:filamentous hemagglutinin N-terminal domain-containing protein [Nostoc sp. JL23]MBN3880961.1 filamentous hemagglutinin N-terminal domain-containing protein [Nostoc sp. JL23]